MTTVSEPLPAEPPAEQARPSAAAPGRAFAAPRQEIDAELEWLSLRLRISIERGRRQRALGPTEEHRGLYVADEEVDELLVATELATPAELDALGREAAELRADLDERLAATRDAGAPSPLERVVAAFGLSNDERAILIAALAPHVDRRFERVYAYANDDVTRKHPTVGLLLDLLGGDETRTAELRGLLTEDARLARHDLIRTREDPGNPGSSQLAMSVELDRHLARALMGAGGLDPALASIATLAGAEAPAPLSDTARADVSAVLRRRPDIRIYLGGRWAGEKRAAAATAASEAGLAMIAVDSVPLIAATDVERLVRLLLRDARLLHAALYFDHWDADGEHDANAEAAGRVLERLLDRHPLPLFLAGREPRSRTRTPRTDLQVEVSAPSYAERLGEWERVGAETRDIDKGPLAAMFRLGANEIGAAVRSARSLADWRGSDDVTLDDLRVAARQQSQPRLNDVATRIEPHLTWDDIVLPASRIEQLKEISTQVMHQHVVYDDWGFGSRVSYGRGVSALFVGESGTGKTMAAGIIGHELGLDLYKIDLSGLVSKYIGETEKNLARVFDEAGDSNAILFFDEADAIFGKRTEVRDSHDRYANIEVSYLLQKMEEYDGIVILASNMRSNLDEAFQRRLKAIIDFPFPDEDDRLRIYRGMLAGVNAPMADDVDLEFMARQFRVAGGNIKNIMILAAFLAAEEGASIAMRHLIHATRREYQKLGRLLTESDFAQWYEDATS